MHFKHLGKVRIPYISVDNAKTADTMSTNVASLCLVFLRCLQSRYLEVYMKDQGKEMCG